jgi:hypothetical protein
MIEPWDSQQIWNEMSPFQYCLSHFEWVGNIVLMINKCKITGVKWEWKILRWDRILDFDGFLSCLLGCPGANVQAFCLSIKDEEEECRKKHFQFEMNNITFLGFQKFFPTCSHGCCPCGRRCCWWTWPWNVNVINFLFLFTVVLR